MKTRNNPFVKYLNGLIGRKVKWTDNWNHYKLNTILTINSWKIDEDMELIIFIMDKKVNEPDSGPIFNSFSKKEQYEVNHSIFVAWHEEWPFIVL